MKRKLILILANLFQSLDRVLVKNHIKRPTVVISLDGGIASQMFNYIKGIRFEEAGCEVLFDLRWFYENGMDLTGKFSREYELQEMFPKLNINTVSPSLARKWYSRFFKHDIADGIVNPVDIHRTTFLGSHYEMDTESFARLFPIYFNEKSIKKIECPWAKNDNIHCGVHVRRGDLSNGQYGYGLVSKTYFEKAIQYVQNNNEDVVFHFFSDEMDWVEENILPNVNIKYELIKGNKAWVDLALLTQCDIIIASQGSFGITAARLKQNARLVLCEEIQSSYMGERTQITWIK